MTAAAVAPGSRSGRLGLLGTTVGKKIVVAITGLGWIGFVVAHMIGNLKLFMGPAHLNDYAAFLRSMGEPIFPHGVLLWIMRIALIGLFVAHVGLTARLTLRNRASRSEGYAKHKTAAGTRASLTMRWGGLALFLFIFVHLAHFTWGWLGRRAYGGTTFQHGAPYENVTNAFYHQPVWAVLYIIPMIALGMHMYHGLWSTMQTLGVNRKRWDKVIRTAATGLAVVTAGGNIAIVLAATTISNLGK